MILRETHKYDDIIHLARPVSHRAKMTDYDRAAQFSPFAALTGFEAAIEETGRQTDSRPELDEDEMQRLDERMQKLRERIHTCPGVKILWFRRDRRKTGGACVSTEGHAKKIDPVQGKLFLSDGREIPLAEILSLQMKKEPGLR